MDVQNLEATLKELESLGDITVSKEHGYASYQYDAS
jgi:hypothetical protein